MPDSQAHFQLRRRITRTVLLSLVAYLLCPSPTSARHQHLKPQASVESLIEQGRHLEQRGDFVGEVRATQQALAWAERLHDERLVAMSLTQLGRAYLRLNQPNEALLALQRALRLAQRKTEKPLLLPIYQAMGELATVQGQYEPAINHFQQAKALAEELGDQRRRAAALTSMANVYTIQGETAKALATYQQALPLAREPGDQVSVLINLGAAYLNQADYERALDYFQRARHMAEQLNDPPLLNTIASGVAQIYTLKGDTDQALQMYQQVLRAAEAWGQSSLMIPSLISVGVLHLQRDDPAQAETYLRRGWLMAQRSGAPLPAAIALLGLGTAHRRQHQYKSAQQEIQQARRLGEELGVNRIVAVAHAELGKLYQALGQWDLAFDHFRQAIRRLESISRGIPLSQQRAQFFGSVLSPYEDLMAALVQRHQSQPNQGYLAEAVTYVERARARTLLDQLAEARITAPADLDPELRHHETMITQQITQIQGYLQSPSLAPTQRAGLVQALRQAEQAYEQLTVKIRQHNPRYADLRHPEPITSEQIQHRLPPETALLEYVLGKEHAWLFVITRNRLRVYPLALDQAWLEGLENYLRLLADERRADSQALLPIARRLYDQLLAAALSELPSDVHRLVISPDGLLNYLPFETLVRPCRQSVARRWSLVAGASVSTRGQQSATSDCFLIESYTISYTPSATVLNQLTHPAPAPDQRNDLVVFADPSLDLNREAIATSSQEPRLVTLRLYDEEGFSLAPLRFARSEAEAIATYARQGLALFLGQTATEDQVKKLPLQQYKIIHFATHSFVVEQVPARSAIVLSQNRAGAEDGFLQVREIYDLKLDADLVVLSACQTGRGPFIAGDGVQGLPRAFFTAGARAVLMSLWDVNDHWTAELMKAFYRRLSEGLGKAEALRQAKLSLLTSAEGRDPRLWAALVLTGEADQPIGISGPSWLHRYQIVLMVFAIIVTLILSAYFLRRRLRRLDSHTN